MQYSKFTVLKVFVAQLRFSHSGFILMEYSRRSLSRTLKGPAKKFEIAKVRDDRCSR